MKRYIARFLTQIQSNLNNCPLSITSNFEKAFLNVVGDVFGDTQLQSCFFHYKQAMWRKIQELSLVPLYNTDEDI
ncbi:mule transposase [Brachionus plicatilis]|uniref:Mule transposase n=1 Tax=Brachionus plicatilis TaxID=10195 RepID=A0A3M7QY39_BRAPC|nr:mule transposase [Brachionus plicatilis]